MTRSRRHHPFYSNTGTRGAMAKWRRLDQQRLRRRNKVRVNSGEEPAIVHEVSNLWDSPQDGWRQRFDPVDEARKMRK
jgi:hypothetical protein